MVKQIATLEALQKELSEHKVVLVDFFAEWCGPCKRIAPEIESQYEKVWKAQGVHVVKVDVDENDDAAKHYKIQAMPTFKVFVNGKEVADIVGASLDKIKKAVEDNRH